MTPQAPVTIRPEQPGDHEALRRVNEVAFERADEAGLVDRLRLRAAAYVGLVAVHDGMVVGHIAFTSMTLEPPRNGFKPWGLAPMAVLPDYQRQGVGTKLVREGLAACRYLGGDAVFVLGHPDYYPRFGFRPASEAGFTSDYEVPDEAFMVLELVPGALNGMHGRARYDPEFAE